MNRLIEWIQNLFQGGITDTQVKVILTLLIIIILWFIRRLLKRSVVRIQISPAARYSWRKTISYSTNALTLIGIAFLWSNQFASLATFLGLLSAGLAIAFKDPIVNMAGWYFLVFRKPFKVGDRIQINENIGDVIDVNLFEFSIIEVGNWVNSDQSTGRVIHIPNMKVFSSPIANYNAIVDFIWNEVEVVLTFESDWKKAKQLFTDLINREAPKTYLKAEKDLKSLDGEYLVYYNKLTPIVYTHVVDHGIVLTLRFLCPPKQRRASTQKVWEAILDCIQQEKNIDFAYPTRRIIGKSDIEG